MLTEDEHKSFKARIADAKEKLQDKLSGDIKGLQLLNDLQEIADLTNNGYYDLSKKVEKCDCS